MDPLVMRVHAEKLRERPENMKQAEALGSQVINGHHCHGWRESGTEVWFDDDYGCEVLAKTGGMTSTMTAFSPLPPDASVFQPPLGYVLVSTPATNGFSRGRNRSRIMRDLQLHIR
jgi:hypothetical protein